jgi:hypothetical protein
MKSVELIHTHTGERGIGLTHKEGEEISNKVIDLKKYQRKADLDRLTKALEERRDELNRKAEAMLQQEGQIEWRKVQEPQNALEQLTEEIRRMLDSPMRIDHDLCHEDEGKQRKKTEETDPN